MKNLNSTISKENAKSNGRNEDLIDKLTWKLEDLEDLLAKKGPTSSTKQVNMKTSWFFGDSITQSKLRKNPTYLEYLGRDMNKPYNCQLT